MMFPSSTGFGLGVRVEGLGFTHTAGRGMFSKGERHVPKGKEACFPSGVRAPHLSHTHAHVGELNC